MADYDFTYTGAEIQAILDTGKKLKDSGYIFLGVATPSTNPGTPTQKVYYEAKQAGTYTNFGGVVLPDGISLLKWNGSWTSETVMCGDGGVFDISVYKSSGGTLATFADLAAALNGGNNIPVGVRKGGMSVKFVQSSDNKYVQFRLMADEWSTTESDWQGVIDETISESDDLVKSKGIFEAIKKSERGFVVDYNHLWNFVAIDDDRNRYAKYDTFDCIWISIPKGAKRVHVDGIPDSGNQYYYFSSYDISNSALVCFRNYQEVKIVVISKTNGADFVPYFVGESTPILLLIDVRKSELPEGFSYDDIRVWFDYVEDTVNCESSLNGKKISILGDSMSGFATYTYWMDGDTKKFNNRYPARASYEVNNIMSIHQMWWKRLFNKCGAILEVGSCIGSSGISDNRYYERPSYLDRYADLGNPDVIFIQGFHNEPSTAACTFNPSIHIGELDTLDVGQAYDKLIRLLKITYPSTRIIDIVIVPDEKWVSASREIDDYYNIEHIECSRSDIDFTTITTDTIHPDSDGMERIADYVIERLANNATHVATEEFVAENTLEEVEITNSEENVVGYLTDKNRVIIGKLMKNGAVEWTAKNSRDILLDGKISGIEESIQGISGNLSTQTERIDELDENAIREFEIDDTEEDVAAYITEKNGVIIAKINKDGSIDRLVENDKDKHTVHFEDVDIEGIVNLLTDNNNNVVASINDKAEVDFYGGGGFAGEKTTEAKTGEYVRLLVSKNKVVVGGVKKDGTVHLFKAKIDNLDTEVDINITALINALPVITSGLNNVEISNDQRIINLLTSVNSTKVIDIKGVDIKNKLKPIMSIIDDDTVDGQIPSSMGSSIPDNNGGYFSVLLPIILSLNDKYGINAKVGLACEGHRVGLTSFYQPNDDYSQLNENGNLLKLLSNKIGWDILNHSMSAQLPVNTYGVDSINSALADQILAEGTYSSPLSFYNTIVLDKSTGKWYEVNSTKTAWVERVPTKKYAMQYYRDYGTNNYHINRDFDFDYSWGEWCRRAKELGLPYKSCIVYNGSSTSPFVIAASRKYAEFGVRTTLDRANVPPIPAAVARYTIAQSSDSNAEVEATTEKMKSLVDECYSKHSWLVWMSHANSNSLQNRYNTGVDYGSKKDDNYSSEWEIPLNASEITTMDANNYWVNPPARLGISRWKDWHPAPGTQIGAFYEVLEYAISKGIDIVTPTEGWSTHGNLMQIGVDMMDTHAIYHIVDAYTDAEQSFLTIGADGSIRYFSK